MKIFIIDEILCLKFWWTIENIYDCDLLICTLVVNERIPADSPSSSSDFQLTSDSETDPKEKKWRAFRVSRPSPDHWNETHFLIPRPSSTIRAKRLSSRRAREREHPHNVSLPYTDIGSSNLGGPSSWSRLLLSRSRWNWTGSPIPIPVLCVLHTLSLWVVEFVKLVFFAQICALRCSWSGVNISLQIFQRKSVFLRFWRDGCSWLSREKAW